MPVVWLAARRLAAGLRARAGRLGSPPTAGMGGRLTGPGGPPVYGCRGWGAPSYRLGRIYLYVWPCSATNTNNERGDWRT